jgi:3-oxoadipate enol-lactonase
MPDIEANGARLHYEEVGSGSQTIVFVHGLTFDGGMFEAQVAAFRGRYRCITMDLRGHGRSESPAGGYDMDTFTADAAALIDRLGAAPCHFVGWSIGGFMGLRLAIHRPELLRSLTLIGSAALRASDFTFSFKITPFLLRTFGMGAAVGSLSKTMFAPSFLQNPDRKATLARWQKHWRAADGKAIARTAQGVLRQSNVESDLAKIRLPTLVISGELDSVCPPSVSGRTAAAISGSKSVLVAGAGHACTIEEPDAVNRALGDFFESVERGTPK